MKLTEAISQILTNKGDSNRMSITINPNPEIGWGMSYSKQDRHDGDIAVVNKDSLNEWNNGEEWNVDAINLCADWIEVNLRDWLHNEDNYKQLMRTAYAEL